MLLKHSQCGGDLILDVSEFFIIKSPGLSVSMEGIFIEMSEITVRPLPRKPINAVCRKCSDVISILELEKINTLCLCCSVFKPISEINVSQEFSGICNTCMEFLKSRSDKSEIPEYIKKIKQWVEFTTGIKSIPLSKLLKEKIVV
jgi:hypothetical protein